MYGRPLLIVFSGPPLTGKSTAAEEVKRQIRCHWLDVDIVRKEIVGIGKKESDERVFAPEYELRIMKQAYTLLCQKAKEYLSYNKTIVLSGTFSRVEFKKPLKDLCDYLDKEKIPIVIFCFNIPDNEVVNRIQKRRREKSLSNIDTIKKYEWAKTFYSQIEFLPVIIIDTTCKNYLAKIIKIISSNKFNRSLAWSKIDVHESLGYQTPASILGKEIISPKGV